MNHRPRSPLPGLHWLFLAFVMCGGCSASPGRNAGENLSADDAQRAIKLAVLRDLFQMQDARPAPIKAAISAYVIQDPADCKQLAAAFAGHAPAVTCGPAVKDEAGQERDQRTGGAVEVYAARIRDISCDRARVGAGWHSDPLSGTWYTYQLQRVGGVWIVQRRTVVGVS